MSQSPQVQIIKQGNMWVVQSDDHVIASLANQHEAIRSAAAYANEHDAEVVMRELEEQDSPDAILESIKIHAYKQAYWRTVQQALITFFDTPASDADHRVSTLRERIEERTTGDQIHIAYHEEEYETARSLARAERDADAPMTAYFALKEEIYTEEIALLDEHVSIRQSDDTSDVILQIVFPSGLGTTIQFPTYEKFKQYDLNKVIDYVRNLASLEADNA